MADEFDVWSKTPMEYEGSPPTQQDIWRAAWNAGRALGRQEGLADGYGISASLDWLFN